MKRFVSGLALLLVLAQAGIYAQENFRIVGGTGRDFALIRGDSRQDFIIDETDLNLILLGEGDYLMTGEGTFLEMVDSSEEIRLMVGEDSSLSFEALNEREGSLITLSYGHIHGLIGSDGVELWINGYDTVCLPYEGEFGYLLDYDLTLDQPEVLSRIYSLEGTVEVRQMKELPGENKRVEFKKPLLIRKGEMVITSSWERDLPLEAVFFDADYSGFWKKHPFTHTSLVAAGPLPVEDADPAEGAVTITPLPTTEEILPVMPEEEPLVIDDKVNVKPRFERDMNLINTGAAGIILGSVLMTGSAVSHLLGNSELGVGLSYMGGFNLLAGLSGLGYAYLSEPAE